MRILCVAATSFEFLPLVSFLNENGRKIRSDLFVINTIEVQLLVTGVGIIATTYQLTSILHKEKIDLVLNLGVAGSLDPAIQLGDVVEVVSERIGDLGAEDIDGSFLDLQDLKLPSGNPLDNQSGQMINSDSSEYGILKKVAGVTVNKVHGSQDSIDALKRKYPGVQIESMEGAAIFFVCLNEKIPFLEIRGISNFVEPRNKENWVLDLAIDNLNQVAIQLIQSIT
ncbi:MAG: futalosine hydrolase [Bacteroidota bacterium]